MPTILGVDPGLNGALSFYDGTELILFDMPTLDIIKNGKKRRKVDAGKLKALIDSQKPDYAVVELVSAQPGNGAAHAFTYGFGCGVLEAVIICCSLPFTYVSPMKWKKAMECTADKESSRAKASELLPEFAHNWDRKKDDGRAESALLALYGYGGMGE